MKHILIPTDFSDPATSAAGLGIAIAKKLKLEITFLHLISTAIEWTKLDPEKEKLYPEVKAEISKARANLQQLEQQAQASGIEAKSILETNMGLEKIEEYVTPDDYELVVMGTHGEKGLEKVLGSNTQKVIKHSTVPVLGVKQYDGDFSSFKKLLIASDFDENSETGFRKLAELGKKLGLDIYAVYVNVPYNFMESLQIDSKIEIFSSKLEGLEIKPLVINANNEERGIGMAIGKINPDIAACITHKRSAFLNLFVAGITESIINNFDIPILSIHD